MPSETALTPSSVEILVRVSHRFGRPSQSDNREGFWQPFIEDSRRFRQGREEPLDSVDTLETRLKSSFGTSLKHLLEGLAPGSLVTAESQRRAALAVRTVVSTRIVGYSSLDLGVTFEPIKNVVQFFDGNFEYFLVFLASYMPQAFSQSIRPRGGWYVEEWQDIVAGLDFVVTNRAVIAAEFGKSATSGANRDPVEHRTIDKARWVWILANTSLVVPTLLAAWYLYSIERGLETRQTALDDGFRALLKAQAELIQTLSAEKTVARNGSAAVSEAAPKARDAAPPK